MSFGDHLKQLRLKSNLTRGQVGEAVGVAGSTIARYESGELDIKRSMGIKLAKVYNVKPVTVMGFDNPDVYSG